jgi:hypothetical protein
MSTWVWIALLLVCTSTSFFLAALLANHAESERDAEREQLRRLALLSPEERLEDLKRRAYEQRDL